MGQRFSCSASFAPTHERSSRAHMPRSRNGSGHRPTRSGSRPSPPLKAPNTKATWVIWRFAEACEEPLRLPPRCHPHRSLPVHCFWPSFCRHRRVSAKKAPVARAPSPAFATMPARATPTLRWPVLQKPTCTSPSQHFAGSEVTQSLSKESIRGTSFRGASSPSKS